MAAKNYVRENVPLSRFGVLVAQLESIAASAAQQPPESLLCFDLLSDLLSAIDEEPKDSILLWQRKCEDALYSLLILGVRRPVRHLASVAMAQIILKGDGISIYSRASSLQGFLSDGKRTEPMRVAGAAQCLGELYHLFGRRITSGFLETTIIATKLMKFNEDYVRQEALHMLQNALEGSGGNAASSAYTEAFRLLMRFGVGDKSTIVRIAAARCLKAFANIGGPALGIGELDNAAAYCVKALEDTVSSVRDAFAEALGMVLALGMNPAAQVQPRGKGQSLPANKFEGGLQRHLALPFAKASGVRSKDIRIGITLSWVFFLQAMRLRYMHPDSELQNYALQIMEMIRVDTSVDAQSLACILYILRVGITDQMTELTQRSFLVFLAKQLQSHDISPSMEVAALHTLSYTLKTLGEVPLEFREVLDNTVLAAVSHSSQLVRIEAALTIRVLAEVDPTCVGGLISYGLTILSALRDSVPFGKGSHLKGELDSLHGQATALAALVSISPKLPLGYPARLPLSVLESSKKMLTSASRNPVAAAAEEEAGWLLLSSLLFSMPKEELEDQVFDILSLWVPLFNGSVDSLHKVTGDLELRVCVWSASIDALTGFVRCFLSPSSKDIGILLQPVLFYLSRALSYISFIAAKELPNMKHAMHMLIIRTLIAYQSLPDPLSYKSDHPQIIQLCTTPFRDSSECEESSCLRLLLDKRDAWLGPWVPGRDWFEDELRAFQGGKDGLMPCAWEDELCSFPQPETISKTLVNQMLLCFGLIFASQDKGGMLSLISMIEQCLRAGKKQSWHAASVTNICVGLVAGLKALLASRPQPIGLEILSSVQSIFQSILKEVDICPSQRRASSEGLGLLARLGNDIFTARMARSLLGDLASATDSNYAGSIAFTLGCIHRSAGGMALSTLVPSTVSSISLLARRSTASLQIWSLHGLLLTIEAAGFSYVSHVQATLGLALDILLSEDNGLVDLQQGVGRLVNAIVAVLGPELSPGSIFFSRCKSVIMEISSCQETATLLESVRFTQQLVLFAPQAVSVHSHVKILLRTLSSRQPTLRHLAVSTLRHLIEKDPVSVTDEQIENNLFYMLDEETDSEIGNLVRSTIMRLLYTSCPLCPSHWILIFRTLALATMTGRSSGLNNMGRDLSNNPDGETKLDSGEDDENMVSNNKEIHMRSYAYNAFGDSAARDNHLRYRTRVFAAECLSHLPSAVGKNPAHFDLCLARNHSVDGKAYGDWLILHLEELIALAYQISTIQFESMQPIGVGLLSTIMDKFGRVADPELPGHLLLEQYQAQLVSAVRTALDMSSGPVLLEAGLRLATKILTSGIISGDQVAVRRIFSLISRPLNDFNDLYYPSFAEWVSCKIKVRLLAAHASLKCYSYAFLMRGDNGVPDEYVALLPLFSKSSSVLGKYWICVLKDYGYTCVRLHPNKNWKPFLDGIQSSLVSLKLRSCLEEAWPVILQAISLDAVPADYDVNESSISDVGDLSRNSSISGYSMVKLELDDFRFVWGFALLVLFQRQPNLGAHILIPGSDEDQLEWDEKVISVSTKLHEIVLPVFQFLSTKRFFSSEFLTLNICEEFLKVVSYSINMEASWSTLAISVLSKIVQNCPEIFLEEENIAFLATELCLAYIFKSFDSIQSTNAEHPIWEGLISPLFSIARTLVSRCKIKQLNLHLAFLLIGYKCISGASTELCFSKVTDYIRHVRSLLENHVKENFETDENIVNKFNTIIGACLNVLSALTKDCVNGIDKVGVIRSELGKLPQLKLAFCIEQIMSFAELAHKTGCQLVIKENATLYFTLLKHCTESIKKILSNSNTQVIAITLQVLKNMTQGSTSAETSLFLMFFLGELFADIFTILRQMLKKPITKESMMVAGECLKTLVLLQALSKTSECQKGLMNLLLEAILYIYGASENDFSQELNEIRSTAIRLVSHLAQIPSSAAHFKDVLLAMPVTHREQLQGIIRASVAQDQNRTDKKSTTPSLIIKLPVQTENYTDEIITSSSTLQTGKNSIDEEENKDKEVEKEEDDDDDDWDTFQSFHASSTTPDNINSEVENAPEELTSDKSPSVSDSNAKNDYFQEYFSSSPSDSVKDNDVEHQLVADDEELISKSASESQSSHPDIVSSDNRSEDRNDEKVVSQENNDQTLTVRSVEHGILNGVKTDHIEQSSHHDMESSDTQTEDGDDEKIVIHGDDHEVFSDIHNVEDDQGLNKVESALVEHGEDPVNDSANEFADDEHRLELNDKALIDQQHLERVDTDAENQSDHPHKGNSDSSLESQDNSDKLRMSD